MFPPKLQDKRRLVLSSNDGRVEILPLGSEYVERLLSARRAV